MKTFICIIITLLLIRSYLAIRDKFSNHAFYPVAIRILLFSSSLILILGSYYGVVDMLNYFRSDDIAYGMLYLFLLIFLSIFSIYMLIASIALPLSSIEDWLSRFKSQDR